SLALIHRTGVYRYNGPGYQPAFRRDSSFDSRWAGPDDHLHALTEDNQGNVWIVYGDRTEILSRSENGYQFSSPDALRLRNEGTAVVDVFVEDSGVAWIAYGDDVLRYDPVQERSYDYYFQALVRRVSPLGERWNVFGGSSPAHTPGDEDGTRTARPTPRLVYDYNDLRFEVAAPSYNDPGRNEFQYFLERHDAEWSAWTSEPAVEYTNLREGAYTLRVRARNGQGYESTEAMYRFTVLPPWYRAWWAYLAYVSLFIAVAALSVHYRRMRRDNIKAQQQARELALERVVNERLTLVNDRLRQADLLKDQLLSNTSHELRTPITAILGFTSVLKDEAPQNLQEFLDIIEENGRRLMRTVTSMVDFARLQAGVIELNREPVEISREVEQVVSRLTHLARKRQLFFELVQPQDLVHAWLDKKCLERIVENLLSNAIKFTEEGGVTVRVSVDDDSVYVRVQDTGIGMNSDFMPDLFQAFKQESSGLTRTHEGSGLGLAITARLVELMDGEIDVKSSKGEGTVVTVSFPVFYVAQLERRAGARAVIRKSSA
ncbi:MAG TPA: HAMP domain-containing sensor histidine kinase, partial [Rhodothermales bacterium]|nr:HAMP domain-containing sensor histidine kinase [Rhodothermales bacterium]